MTWKVSAMLAAEQKNEIVTDMKNTDNQGLIFDWMTKAVEASSQ